ncbi:MAG: hypothetical protein IH898_06810, partial [Planctomycetes bacterium]|nr:hypothetical protein [Planctomycetota bacterium]
MLTGIPLLAAIKVSLEEAVPGVRTLVSYQWQRLSQFDDPRHLWLLVAALATFAAAYVVWFYRRERESLSPLLRWLLPTLRLIAVAGAILFFLGPEKRVDQQEIKDSQVVVLVDTSQSMSVEDESWPGDEKVARGDAVKSALVDSPLLETLRQQHHVLLQGFDTQVRRVARWDRQTQAETESETQSEPEESASWSA